jgi:hypothetical protein
LIQVGKKDLNHKLHAVPNLLEDMILEIDYFHQHSLAYCPDQNSFSWGRRPGWKSGFVKVPQEIQLGCSPSPLSRPTLSPREVASLDQLQNA